MPYTFLDMLSTQSVKAAQASNGAQSWASFQGDKTSDHFTEAETVFIAARDSFYMASVSESGWPYVQHRGGPKGFLRVLDDRTLGFLDFRGNRQYISLGNVAADGRVALILMDYPNRRRLKILAHMEAKNQSSDPTLFEKLALEGYKARPERAFLLHLNAFDWNCPQHITPRFSEAEIASALAPLAERLESLEKENNRLRAALVQHNQGAAK